MIKEIKDHMIEWLNGQLPCNLEDEKESVRIVGMNDAICELFRFLNELDEPEEYTFDQIREACENPEFNERLAKFMMQKNVLD
jgi:hypothetical protein